MRYRVILSGAFRRAGSVRRSLPRCAAQPKNPVLRIIRARVVSGMRNVKAKGAKIGRPQTTLDDIPANFLRHYPAYKNGAFNLSELARLCDNSRTTAYKFIGLLEGKTTAISH